MIPDDLRWSVPKHIQCEIDSYNKKYKDHLQAEIVQRPYDVLKYDIYLDWHDMLLREGAEGEDRYWVGQNTITFAPLEDNPESVTFDCAGLSIINVSVDGNPVDPTPQQIGGELTIPLPAGITTGQEVVCRIDYQYVRSSNKGFYLYKKGHPGYVDYYPPHDTMYVEERLAYTMNEPNDARYWMPCNDHPHDKALATISVRVPEGYSVATNGLLEDFANQGDGVIYRWREHDPIATYLISVTSSIFYEYSDWYHRVSNPQDSIEIKYYMWENDTEPDTNAAFQFHGKEIYKNMPAMLTYLSELLTEYPFDKYGSVSVQPYYFGAMEHQTMTMMNRTLLLGNADFTVFHELMHHWLGDYITCATWNDIWINEGGATWGEMLWATYFYDQMYYDKFLTSTKKIYLRGDAMDKRPIYGPSTETNELFDYAITYCKSAWFYHMLNKTLGDEQFFGALQSLMEKYAYSSLTTEQFLESFKEDIPNPPVSLDKFFDQWLYKQGHPVFSLNAYSKVNPALGGYDIYVNIAQNQSHENVAEVFHTPVVLKFFGSDSAMVLDTLIVTQREQEGVFNMPFVPDSIKIDETFVLCEVESINLSVRPVEAITSEMNIYPNPAISGAELHAGITSRGGAIDAMVYDQLGAPVRSVFSGIAGPGSFELGIPTSGLAPGVYYLRVAEGGHVRTSKFSIIK
ncbi:MAG: M1 family aminopeptidase [Candidatus Kapaibacterium sp.]